MTAELERVDDLRRNGFKIIQYANGFRFGTDAVLLADFVRAGKKDSVMDLGTGNGIIPLLLAARGKGRVIAGVDIKPENVELARRNAELNHVAHFISFSVFDVKNHADLLRQFGGAVFDVVCANPPYMRADATSPTDAAKYEHAAAFADFCVSAGGLLRFGGRFYVVHRPDRLTDVLCQLRLSGLEPKKLRFVCPKAGKEPVLTLIESVKGGKPDCRVLPNLVLYEETGVYTPETEHIYNGQ